MSATQRLHYLHEITEEGGKERFVYACLECSCVLHVSPTFEPVAETIESLENRCPGCNSPLEASICCRSAKVPEAWREVSRSALSARRPRRAETEFKTAASLRGFSFNFAPLDALVGHHVDPRWSVAFRGAPANAVAEFVCFRGQLPTQAGGWDSTVVLIDGGNRSDLYLFSAFAKLYGVHPRKALRRVVTSRAFTMYQLVDLVTNELPRVMDEYGARMVVLSDVFGVLMDERSEVDEQEGRRLAEAVARAIDAARKDALVFTTLATKTPYDRAVAGRADVLVELEEVGGRIVGTMVRHPFMKPASRQFTLRDLLFHNRRPAKGAEG